MNIMKTLGAAALGMAAVLASAPASAQDKGDCSVSYTRAACPGKEAESFAKCDGKASCAKRSRVTPSVAR